MTSSRISEAGNKGTVRDGENEQRLEGMAKSSKCRLQTQAASSSHCEASIGCPARLPSLAALHTSSKVTTWPMTSLGHGNGRRRALLLSDYRNDDSDSPLAPALQGTRNSEAQRQLWAGWRAADRDLRVVSPPTARAKATSLASIWLDAFSLGKAARFKQVAQPQGLHRLGN
jgi:hypothetical protein